MSTLALSVIVRDEAARIGRCLSSARPHVDAMVVVDTGSTDDTVAVARAHGAQVHALRWTDDFSAARNAALQWIDADWVLVLDADEWLQDDPVRVGQVLREAVAQPPFVGLVRQCNAFELAGRVEFAPSWIPRLLPRGVRYAGRVHEQPVSTLPRRRLSLSLGHDGYLGPSRASKRGRNAALLRQSLQQAPDDGYLWFQLGKDLAVHDDHAAAIDAYERALACTGPDAAWRHDLVVRTLFSLKRAGQMERALLLAADEMDRWPASPDFHFALGDVLLDQAVADPPQALDRWLPMARAAWQRCLEIGEQPLLEGTVVGRGSFLAAHNLAVLYDGIGDAPQARHYRAMAQRLRADATA